MPEPMDSTSSKNSTFRKVITLLASVIVLIHLTICIYIILYPNALAFNSETLTYTYKRYALPGPYFKEAQIKSSTRFCISGKHQNEWEAWRNVEDDNFKLYHQSYWRYDKLMQARLERQLAYDLCRKVVTKGDSTFTNYPEFKALHKYFYSEYFKTGADSIRLLYTTSTFKPRELKTKIDTLFFLKYKP
jgi:hypothetical protein